MLPALFPYKLLPYGFRRKYRPQRFIPKQKDLKSAYDVVIIGGGGHALACAYYLARYEFKGSKIIYVGMMQSEVLEYCGEPTSKMVDNQRVRSANNQVLGYSRVERWKYESYSVTRRLVFVDEKLQAIERW